MLVLEKQKQDQEMVRVQVLKLGVRITILTPKKTCCLCMKTYRAHARSRNFDNKSALLSFLDNVRVGMRDLHRQAVERMFRRFSDVGTCQKRRK